MLSEDEASVFHRPPTAQGPPAKERVGELPRSQGTTACPCQFLCSKPGSFLLLFLSSYTFFHFRIIGYIRICLIGNDFCLITESPFAKDSACHSGESP